MRYLIDKDFAPTIRAWVLNSVNGGSTFTQEDAESAAVEIASSYLRGRYDVSKIFVPIYPFTTGQNWNIGEIVYNSATKKTYVALVNNPGDTLTDAAKWEEKDPRNKALVMYVVDIAVYYLHSNLSPQNIPELRVKRYDDAIRWFERVQMEKISPDLPLANEDQPSSQYSVGSNPKVTQRW